MIINLKKYPEYNDYQQALLELTERLPQHIQPPCELVCQFKIEFCRNYYLLSMTVSGKLTIICQRCLNEFTCDYSNSTELALCASETIAEKLMAEFETVVYEKDEVDLKQLVTDELFLYSPMLHEHVEDCDAEMQQHMNI
ncbi:DUF177 domain-containing protein [Legionella sp. 16cNR16C]|uniref:YceD family protein n=1 Tax=Legionella sp. 16cNR16C TaxID=2905656 RepID=UPI001E5185C0|nr:YceD family protein [Legionella sp. 16cNR16C]MCE3043748.1 YceD family protein [Legionella sp. 16cNR16C]